MVDQCDAAGASQVDARGTDLLGRSKHRQLKHSRADRQVWHCRRNSELVNAVVGSLGYPKGFRRGIEY